MLLTDNLEDLFEFEEQQFFIDMSFNIVLTIFEVLKDDELSKYQQLDTALYLLTGKDIELPPKKMEELLNAILEIHLMEEKVEDLVPKDILGNPMPVERKKASYSFEYDAEFIFSSFMQAYGIDLIEQQGKMHWKKFIALFKGLPEDTIFMRVVSIRERELPTGKGTEKERAQLIKLKQQYKLPEEER